MRDFSRSQATQESWKRIRAEVRNVKNIECECCRKKFDAAEESCSTKTDFTQKQKIFQGDQLSQKRLKT